jgi:hypothetical protein
MPIVDGGDKPPCATNRVRDRIVIVTRKFFVGDCVLLIARTSRCELFFIGTLRCAIVGNSLLLFIVFIYLFIFI